MATNPQFPGAQAQIDDPWKGITARDVLLDPMFHNLPISTRKLILGKVWPDYSKASIQDQDATLNVAFDDWLKQAEETAPKEPGLFEQAWGKIKDTIGQGIESYAQALPAEGIAQRERVGGAIIESAQRAKPFVTQQIPDWTSKAVESAYKSGVALKDAAAKRIQGVLEPPPEQYPTPITQVGPRGVSVRGPFKPFTEVRPLEPPPVYPALPAPTPAKKTGQGYGDQMYGATEGIGGKEAKAPGIRNLWGFTDFWKSLWEEQKQYAPALPVLSEKGKNYLPFGGAINESLFLWDVSRASKRASEGKASPADIKVLEDYRSEQEFAGVKGMEIARTRIDEILRKPIGRRTQEDFKFLDDVKGDRIDYADLATGRGEKIGSILAQYGGFALEMATTAGAFSGVRALAKAGLLRSLRTLIKPDQKIMRAALKLAGQATGTAAGAAVQTLVMPQMILRTGLQKKLQGEVMPKLQEAQDVVTKMGLERGAMPRPDEVKSAIEHSLQDYQDDFLPHMLMAVPDTFAELLTERVGGILEGGIGRLAKMPVGKRISAVKETLLNRFLGMPGSTTRGALAWIRSRTGWNGVAGEVFEERVADLMHEAQGRLGIEEKIGDEAPATWRFITGEGSRLEAFKEMMDQIVNETIAFSVPGIVGGVYSRVAGKVQRSIIKGKLVAQIDDLMRQKVEDEAQAGAPGPGLAPPPPARGPAGLTEPTIRELKEAGFTDQEIEVMDAPLAHEALTWLMMQERAQQEMTRQAAPATAPTEGVAPITPTEGLSPPPLGAALPTVETPALADRYAISQRVVTPDGPGVVAGTEKGEEGGDIVKVQLDSGADNTYPTGMVTLEIGQEIVASKQAIEESKESLQAQIDSLLNGQRFAVVLPPTLSSEDIANITTRVDDSWGRVDHPSKGVAIFDPTKITEGQVRESLDTGNEHILMGAVEPLSDQTTTEVIVTGQDGTQIDLHRVSPDNAQEEARRLAETAPEGATIEIRQEGDVQTIQKIDSNVGLPELDSPPRNLNPENKIALGLGLVQEDYLVADPLIPKDVMPGSGEEDGYVYGIKLGMRAITEENIETVKASLDPGLGGVFAGAAAKGFAAARGEEEPKAPAAMQSWKAEFRAHGEQGWGTNAFRFATEQEAKDHGSELFARWWGADEFRAVQSEDPVKHQWQDGRVVDIERVLPKAILAPPPENSLLIYTPWGVLPRETTGDRTEERADQAIDTYDRMLEEMEAKDPKAPSMDAYQEIKRNRDEVAWGRRPGPDFGTVKRQDPVLTLREWPSDTPTPRMVNRALHGPQITKAMLDFMLRDERDSAHNLNREILLKLIGDKSDFSDEQIDRFMRAMDSELETERVYDQALATTDEDHLVAIHQMFGVREFFDKFFESGGSYSVFHNLVTSRYKSQESATIDLPDGTRLDVAAKFGQLPKVEVQRYKFLLGRTPVLAKSGKNLTKAIFDHFTEKMKVAATPNEGAIVLVGDRLEAAKRAIEKVKKAMPGSVPSLAEVELLSGYTIGHLTVDPRTEPEIMGLRALAVHLSKSTDATDRQVGKMIEDQAPSIFGTKKPIEEPDLPPRSVAGGHIVAAMWIFEGVSRATAWVYKDADAAKTAIQQIKETAKPKAVLTKLAPKGWTENDIQRTLRNTWAVSNVEIIIDGETETTEAKKGPEVTEGPPGNPYEGKMPDGVKYIGPVETVDGTYAHIFGTIDPETTVTIFPGDSLIEKVGESRQKWAEDQRKSAIAREGTEHPRMTKPPFSYSRDLADDPGLSARDAKMSRAALKDLQEKGLADKVIELSVSGMDANQITDELMRLMPDDLNRTVVRMEVLSIRSLKGIPLPNTSDHKDWTEKVALQIDDYNREPGVPPTREAMPEPPPQPEEAPVLTFKKARIIPTRAGYTTEPIPSVEEAPEPVPPIEAPKDAEAEAARQKLRDRLRQKRGGKPKSYGMAAPGGEAEFTPEELMGDMEIIGALVTLGEKYHATGASRDAWHSSMWHEAEDIEEGFGDVVEEIFPRIWEAITGETDYAGGTGGVYGRPGGRAETGPGAGGYAGGRLPDESLGGAHVGIQPPPSGEAGEVEGVAGIPPGEGPPRIEDLAPSTQTRPEQDASQGIGGVGVTTGPGGRPRDDGRFYKLTEEDRFGKGTPGQKIEANIEAIRTLVELRASGEPPTDEQKQRLAKYVGWGAFQTVFDDNQRYQNEKAYNELRELLTGDEWAHARASTIHAFYTDFDIASAMWYVADQLGFKGNGTVCEPALGSGVFFGTAPDHVANNSSFLATELDLITAEIARHLYPAAKIFARGYQKLEFPDGTIDLFISNPPFGGKIVDSRYPDEVKAAIHDYFFIKSLDKLREGGLLIFVTSHWTMDKTGTTVRQMMTDRADLVTAIRLPNTAFVDNAGTGVTTDILILKKRAAGDLITGESFLDLVEIEKDIKINEYFARHPENMLGRMTLGHGLYSDNEGICVPLGDPKKTRAPQIAEMIRAIADKLPADIYREDIENKGIQAINFAERFAPENVWEAQIIIDPETDNLMRNRHGSMVPIEENLIKAPSNDRHIRGLIGVRDVLWSMLRLQLDTESDEALELPRKLLNQVYDRFVDEYGRIDSRKTKSLFGEDPTYFYLAALENLTRDNKVIKADIFSKRTMRPQVVLAALPEDPRQALLMIYAYRGFADLNLMAKLTGRSAGELERDLRGQRLLFKDPQTGQLSLPEEYLSGDVITKWESAVNALELDPNYQINVDALKEAWPKQVPITGGELGTDGKPLNIEVRLGAPWIELQYYEEFARHLFGDEIYVSVSRNEGGKFKIDWEAVGVSRWERRRGEVPGSLNFNTWGVPLYAATDLLVDALNQQRPTVTTEDLRTGTRKKDKLATLAALRKQLKIKTEFDTWAKTSAFAQKMQDDYNYRFNRIRLREYNGQHLTFAGMATDVLRIGDLDPHQKNFVWRGVLDGRGMLAHPVGWGKTFTMAALAMELRRMGLAMKCMLTTPKNVVAQFANDFARLYPGAKILCPTEADFSLKNRKKMLARIALEDWDAIIITPEQLGKIPISPGRLAMTINEELWALEQTRRALGESDDGSRGHRQNVKKIEKAMMNKRAILEELSNLAKDQTIFFDHLGVDYLFIDECQIFKNLGVSTKMGSVSGLTTEGNKRSLDLKAKTDFLLDKGRGRGVFLSSGTPVSNSMTELYTMTRYVAPELLRNAGIRMFDDWAANFGSVAIDWELGPDGRTYKQKLSFSQWTNLPQLSNMFRTFADVVTTADANLPIPKLKNEGPTVIELPMTEEAKRYFEMFTERAKDLEGGQVDKKVDNWLKLTGDAKRASLDLRTLDPGAPDIPESKLNVSVRHIAEYYHQYSETLRTQVVFTELKKFANGNLIYAEMKKKLVDLGVKPEEIAIIHDYEREDYPKLYEDMNKGKIRILLTTRKTAEGANMQERLGKLYHLDAAWTPKDMEQREGRMIRQGNLHFEWDEPVEVVQYITRNSYDSVLFKVLRRKANFIRAYLKGDTNVRSANDPSGRVVLNYELISILASGNPDALEKIQLENGIADLEGERTGYLNTLRQMKIGIEVGKAAIARLSAGLVGWRKVLETHLDNREPFLLNIDGTDFMDPDAAVDHVRKMKESGRPNPEIEKLQEAGKEMPPEMPLTVPYQPKINGRYYPTNDAIAKINFDADPDNRQIVFTATIAGETFVRTRSLAGDALKALIKRNDPGGEGKFTADITLYNVPVQVVVNRYVVAWNEKREPLFNISIAYNIANLETFVTTDVDAILGSAEHKFRNIGDRVSEGEESIRGRIKDIGNMEVEVLKPWDGDSELDLKRRALHEIDRKLGITDHDRRPDEDAEDIDETELEEEEEPTDDPEEYSDRFYSLMDPYSHIPRQTSDSGRREEKYPQGTRETPTGDVFPEISKSEDQGEDRSEGREIQESRRRIEFPELERDEKMGPAFMFEAEATAEIVAALDAGKLPDTFREKLQLNGRTMASVIQVAMIKKGRYEISDGSSILSVYANDNGGLEVWDPTGYGRIEIPELIWMIEQITKNPLGLTRKLRRAIGHFVPDGAGGYVEVRPELFFDMKDHEVLARTIGHELGHAIDFQPDFDMSRGNLLGRIMSLHKYLKHTHGELKGLSNREFKKDLRKLSDFWRPWEPEKASDSFKKYRNSAVELYADFISAVLLSPGTAEVMAPTFYRAFHRKLDLKPEVKEEYFKLRLMLQGTKEEMLNHRLQRLGTMLKTAEEMNVAISLEGQLKSRHWAEFREDYDDMRWLIKQRARKAIRAGVLSWDDAANPLAQWDEFPLKVRTDMYRHAEKVRNKVIEPLKQLGLDFHDLGGFMQLNRSATERLNMANPIFGPGKYAVGTLEHLRNVIGDAKYQALENAARTYHDIRWPWVEEGLRSGVYSQEMFDKKFLPNKYTYGKFTPLEHLDAYVSPTVKSQIGYAGPIANTFIETFKMDMALIRLVALNDAKTSSLDFLGEFYPKEVIRARITRQDDKGLKEFEKSPRGYDLVEVMKNGETVGYHVDKYIAESLNTVSADAARGLSAYAELFKRKFYWPLVILYNIGFSSWANPVMDFLTNWRKLPLKRSLFLGDLFQLVGGYARAIPHVWNSMVRGREDEAVKELIDSYSFSIPLSDVVLDEMDSLNLIFKKTGLIGDIGKIHRGVAAKVYNVLHGINKFMSGVLEFGEMTQKLAGRMIRKDAGETGKKLAFNVRNFTSTPNFEVKGHKTRTSDSWFPFSNIIKEGWKSEYLAMTEPGTKGGYWLRTAKLLGLSLLCDAAEIGLFGDPLKKFYASITRYIKNNYFCLGWGPPDEQGRVTVFTLPKDPVTRLLSGIMREMILAAVAKDPSQIANIFPFLFAQTPSLTPLAKIPAVNAAWFVLGINYPDFFRMTPMLPEVIAKAGGLTAAKRMLQWSMSEIGLGQYTTWDPDKQTFYQWWVQVDPTVGKLVGRMFRVTNYGITERMRGELNAVEQRRAVKGVERREMPGVARFYEMNYRADMANTLLKDAMSKGMSYKDAIQEYPEAVGYRGLASTIQRIARVQKQLNAVEADKSLTSGQRDSKMAALRNAMEVIANRAVAIVENRGKAPALAEPPIQYPGLLPPPGAIRNSPNLPEPPR